MNLYDGGTDSQNGVAGAGYLWQARFEGASAWVCLVCELGGFVNHQSMAGMG